MERHDQFSFKLKKKKHYCQRLINLKRGRVIRNVSYQPRLGAGDQIKPEEVWVER